MSKPWGYHLLIDCQSAPIEKITDKENIRQFVRELVERIDMVAFGDLWIERFATHDADKAGISFVQMIETSNITGHFVEKSGNFYIDVFSCKPFEVEVVMATINQFFRPSKSFVDFVYRDADRSEA